MAQLCTLCTPDGVKAAVGELDQVKGVLNVFVQLIHGNSFITLILAAHAAVKYRERLALQILTEEEVFIKAQAVALVIVGSHNSHKAVLPAVPVALAGFDRADGILPAVAVFKAVALYYSASGEAEEAGLNVSKSLSHIGAETVFAVFKGLFREQGTHINVNSSGLGKSYSRLGVVYGF